MPSTMVLGIWVAHNSKNDQVKVYYSDVSATEIPTVHKKIVCLYPRRISYPNSIPMLKLQHTQQIILFFSPRYSNKFF